MGSDCRITGDCLSLWRNCPESRADPYGFLMPYCYDGLVVHCESEKAFQQVVRHIVQLTGKRPDGFSSTSEPSFATKRLKKLDELQDLPVPQIVLDQAVYDRIELEMATIKEKSAK